MDQHVNGNYSKVVLSVLSVIVVVLAAFSVYENQRVDSLNRELDSLQQSVTSVSVKLDATGLVHSRTIVSGLLFPTLPIFAPGTRYPVVSFEANESGFLAIMMISNMNGSITVGDGPYMVSRSFPVIGNSSLEVNDALVPLIPGNVTVYFEWAGASRPTGSGWVTPIHSGNFTVIYYY